MRHSDMSETLESLDKHEIHVVVTFHPGEASPWGHKPWGYEVYGPWRFIREEANYDTREKANEAGLRAGNEELKRNQS